MHVGTSGYVYQDWRGVFYPEGLPSREWLRYYAGRFDTVELNGTFYRLPPPGCARRWRDTVPAGFVFAAKGSRYLTHMKKLRDPVQGLERYYERSGGLRPKLAVVLWQLPPMLSKPDLPRLDAFLSAQPKDVRHAVEFRSEDWYVPEVCDLLDRHGAAFCEHDLIERRPPRPTGGFRYVRFHGSEPLKRKYHGRYGRERLAPWARDLAAWDGDAFVYFNNDWHGAAVFDALDLIDLIRREHESSRLSRSRRHTVGGRPRAAPRAGHGRHRQDHGQRHLRHRPAFPARHAVGDEGRHHPRP